MEKIPKHQNAHRMHNYGAPSAVPACICSFSINGSCCLFNFFSLLIRWLCPYNMFLFREFYFSRMFEENFCAMQNNKAKWSLDCVVLFTLFFLLHSARVCPGACIKWTAGDSCTAHTIRQIFIHFYDLQRVSIHQNFHVAFRCQCMQIMCTTNSIERLHSNIFYHSVE